MDALKSASLSIHDASILQHSIPKERDFPVFHPISGDIDIPTKKSVRPKCIFLLQELKYCLK